MTCSNVSRARNVLILGRNVMVLMIVVITQTKLNVVSKGRFIQLKLYSSLVITEYSISDINILGTDLFPLKFPLYNRIFT